MARKTKRSNHGFSLMEIMVAMGLLGMVSLGVMRAIEMANKGQKRLNQNVNMNDIWGQVVNVMRDSEVCRNYLTGQNINVINGGTDYTTPTQIVSTSGKVIAAEGTRYGSGGESVEVTDIRFTALDPTPDPEQVNLQMQFDLNPNDAGNGLPLIVGKTLALRIDADAAGNITGCYADYEQLAESICETLLKGVFDATNGACQDVDLYQATAGVGNDPSISAHGDLKIDTSLAVGTSTPTANAGDLSMSGNLAVGGNANITGTTRSQQALTVDAGGATITGASSVDGTLSTTGKLTVSNSTNNSGADIYGSTTIFGQVMVQNGQNLLLRDNSGEDPGDLVFQDSGGAQKARVWASSGATDELYLSSSDTSPDLTVHSNGNITVANHLTVSNSTSKVGTTIWGNLYLPNAVNDVGGNTHYAVTAAWVENYLKGWAATGNLTSQDRNDIMQFLLQSTTDENKESLVDYTLNRMFPANGLSCNSGYSIRTIDYNPTSNSFSVSCEQDNFYSDTRCDGVSCGTVALRSGAYLLADTVYAGRSGTTGRFCVYYYGWRCVTNWEVMHRDYCWTASLTSTMYTGSSYLTDYEEITCGSGGYLKTTKLIALWNKTTGAMTDVDLHGLCCRSTLSGDTN